MLLTSTAPFKYSLMFKSYGNHHFRRYFCLQLPLSANVNESSSNCQVKAPPLESPAEKTGSGQKQEFLTLNLGPL